MHHGWTRSTAGCGSFHAPAPRRPFWACHRLFFLLGPCILAYELAGDDVPAYPASSSLFFATHISLSLRARPILLHYGTDWAPYRICRELGRAKKNPKSQLTNQELNDLVTYVGCEDDSRPGVYKDNDQSASTYTDFLVSLADEGPLAQHHAYNAICHIRDHHSRTEMFPAYSESGDETLATALRDYNQRTWEIAQKGVAAVQAYRRDHPEELMEAEAMYSGLKPLATVNSSRLTPVMDWVASRLARAFSAIDVAAGYPAHPPSGSERSRRSAAEGTEQAVEHSEASKADDGPSRG